MPRRILLIALSCLLLVPASAVANEAAKAGHGAAGIGDPYFPKDGNGGYRVGHYDIKVAYDPGTGRLTGDTTVRARAKRRLTRFNLDLLLRASEVRVNGQKARFRQSKHELVVTPRKALRRGQVMKVRVRYAGRPGTIRNRGEKAWFTSKNGAVAVGQPQVAAWWFPSNDHPRDKATFDVRVTAPARLQAISNGRRVGVRRTGTTATTHWRLGSKAAPYLAFVAIGRFDIEQGRAGGRRYLYAIDRSLPKATRRHARKSMRATAGVTRFLERKWGRYPFGDIGGVVPGAAFGYALENQTRPVYTKGFFKSSASRGIVAHEMAHQWFGDKVALRSWRSIWLNEGYATYSEWLYGQARGEMSADRRFRRLYRQNASDPGYWRLRIGDPGPRRIFAGAVYERGAMTLHALRKTIGSKKFFRLSRRWVHRNDGIGGTREYHRLAEKVSGRQLDGFFRHWLYSGRRPPKP